MAKSKFQAFETETISRDMIKNAPYNPRIMDEKAKKRLRQNIAKHGLVLSRLLLGIKEPVISLVVIND